MQARVHAPAKDPMTNSGRTRGASGGRSGEEQTRDAKRSRTPQEISASMNPFDEINNGWIRLIDNRSAKFNGPACQESERTGD
jgi:hypothetical protein